MAVNIWQRNKYIENLKSLKLLYSETQGWYSFFGIEKYRINKEFNERDLFGIMPNCNLKSLTPMNLNSISHEL